MNAIRRFAAGTQQTVTLGILAVTLAAFGTLTGPAPRVADIGTPWNADLDKASSLSKINELGKDNELDKINALDKRDALDKINEFSKADQLAAKSHGTYMDKNNSLAAKDSEDRLDKKDALGVDQL